MNIKKIFILVLSVLNLAFLGLAIYVISQNIGKIGLLMFIPFLLGLIVFFILKIIMKKDLLKSLKYANLVCFIPACVMVVLAIIAIVKINGDRTAGIAPM